jgi:hypothetical protein
MRVLIGIMVFCMVLLAMPARITSPPVGVDVGADDCKEIRDTKMCNQTPGCIFQLGTVYIPWRKLETATPALLEMIARRERQLGGCKRSKRARPL